MRLDQFLTHGGQSLFSQLPLGDVDDRANVTSKRPARVVSRHTDRQHPPIFAVTAAEPILHPIRLAQLKGLFVPFAASLPVVRMENLNPSIPQRRFHWPIGVVDPGLIEIRDPFLRVRHPDHDRSGICDKAEAFVAFAQGFFGEAALDQIRGLAGEHVEESEVLFGRAMRRPPVRREHAERSARSRSQRRRLYGADSRATIFLLIRGADHEFARLRYRPPQRVRYP